MVLGIVAYHHWQRWSMVVVVTLLMKVNWPSVWNVRDVVEERVDLGDIEVFTDTKLNKNIFMGIEHVQAVLQTSCKPSILKFWDCLFICLCCNVFQMSIILQYMHFLSSPQSFDLTRQWEHWLSLLQPTSTYGSHSTGSIRVVVDRCQLV